MSISEFKVNGLAPRLERIRDSLGRQKPSTEESQPKTVEELLLQRLAILDGIDIDAEGPISANGSSNGHMRENGSPDLTTRPSFYHPFRTAAAKIYEAIVAAGVESLPTGDKKYNFFAGRTDSLRYGGNYHIIGKIVGFFRDQSMPSGTRKVGLMILGESGTGKSSITDGIKQGFEEHSNGPKGRDYSPEFCPNYDPALALTPLETRRIIEHEYNLPVEGFPQACAECEGYMERDNTDPMQAALKPLVISRKRGRGIVKITPRETAEDTLGSHEALNRRYLRANGGIVEISEIGKHSKAYLLGINDLIGNNEVRIGDNTYYPDMVFIAHGNTSDCHSILNEKDFASLRERFVIVILPFNLTRSEEVSIYKKVLASSQYRERHMSAGLLESFASAAIYTRLMDCEVPQGLDNKGNKLPAVKITRRQKLDLYDGIRVDGVSIQDARIAQQISSENKEGQKGISPIFVARQLLPKVLATVEDCIISPAALAKLEDVVGKMSSAELPVAKTEVLDAIKVAREMEDKRTIETVKKAFVQDREAFLGIEADQYYTNAKLAVEGPDFNEQTREKIEANLKVLKDIEDLINKNMTDDQRLELRRHAMRVVVPVVKEEIDSYGRNIKTRLTLEEIKKATYEGFVKEIPELAKAIEGKLNVSDEQAIIVLTKNPTTPLTEAQKASKQNTIDTLVGKYGYCGNCVEEAMQYVAMKLSERLKKV